MSDYVVIADVGETLLKVLRDRLTGLVTPDHVTLASPAEVELDTSPWLAIFLYHVVENVHLRNPPLERLDSARLGAVPMPVDLFYLVVPYAQTRENEHQILGRVLQSFASEPIIRGSTLQGSLAGTAEELRVVYHPIHLEELLRLWGAFYNKPYK